MTTIDKYISQALDAYPFDLVETIESLDYALSYDPNNAAALCLYGRIYSEQLPRYDLAINYFQQAISSDLHAVEVYPFFIQALILNEDFDEAQKLIEFALGVRGINKIDVLIKRAQLQEISKDFEAVNLTLNEIESRLINSHYDDFIEETRKRIDKKSGVKEGKKIISKKKKSAKK